MGGCVFGNVSSPLGDTAVLSAMVRYVSPLYLPYIFP